MPLVGEPFTKQELLRGLRAVHDDSTRFWTSLAAADFYMPMGEAWSPADNVRHLMKTNRPVVKALGLPRPALVLRFGLTWRPSRSFSELRETYRAALARGVTAGPYAPAPEPPPTDPERSRSSLMEERERIASSLESALGQWGEWTLEHLVIPHPVLGRLTAREMVFFTLYHNLHHLESVARRRALLPAV